MAGKQLNGLLFNKYLLRKDLSMNLKVYDPSLDIFSVAAEISEDDLTAFMNQGSYSMNCVTQSEPPVPVVTVEEQVDPPQPPPGDALVPVELAVEELIENYDRKRGNYATQKAAPSQNLIRRREQNRISQRTFREKRAKELANLEGKLRQLEQSHIELLRSHEALQQKVAAAIELLGTGSKDRPKESIKETGLRTLLNDDWEGIGSL
ncbi:hypothetical protein IFR04_003104 [Cadophora malorum]|uniref:BZIP domain-containing protein n=1 Tax=Cadophora malorum TaxID=108018 RepID=A0A8H7WF81_9HELO|nr:hypothetical protein IFR04_003104 [Cadophora malorum]